MSREPDPAFLGLEQWQFATPFLFCAFNILFLFRYLCCMQPKAGQDKHIDQACLLRKKKKKRGLQINNNNKSPYQTFFFFFYSYFKRGKNLFLPMHTWKFYISIYFILA